MPALSTGSDAGMADLDGAGLAWVALGGAIGAGEGRAMGLGAGAAAAGAGEPLRPFNKALA